MTPSRVIRHVLVPARPGPLSVTNVETIEMLRYTIQMPPAPAIGDLNVREIVVSLNTAQEVRPLPPTQASFQFDTEPGVAVSIVLTDIDTAGNRSAPSAPLAFTATDSVPPPQPGGLSVGSVEQIG